MVRGAASQDEGSGGAPADRSTLYRPSDSLAGGHAQPSYVLERPGFTLPPSIQVFYSQRSIVRSTHILNARTECMRGPTHARWTPNRTYRAGRSVTGRRARRAKGAHVDPLHSAERAVGDGRVLDTGDADRRPPVRRRKGELPSLAISVSAIDPAFPPGYHVGELVVLRNGRQVHSVKRSVRLGTCRSSAAGRC